ncbi:MAG: ADP-ribosylglycohydrolase family protein [Snodgrassella sp.]|uniref:ADP-ribosylglycohydrolase family protein n=1 Tax=Snodgrassella sp. TaxID=2815304 RepID=UPI00258CD70B|nr:ADP-ribosylglycohydrolase family protein [Snodgrassella sp.]MCO6520231.1 ADP-ribosylglycohydrolase family protein [Snodgrassella sp.]
MQETQSAQQITGLLLGTAVGDAIGLAREGLTPKRASRLFDNQIQHSLIVTPWGRAGLCSDDTEHAVMVAQSLLSGHQNADDFSRQLASRLRRWFLTLPAGLGMATLKACSKLCLGISPAKSGIRSAGNGAAMRAPVIGWFFADNPVTMREIVRAATIITHTDPRAEEGAWVIAMAARQAREQQSQAPIDSFFADIMPSLNGQQLTCQLQLAQQKLQQQAELSDYLLALQLEKKGVTGYINNTVPAVIYAWLRYYGNYEQTISALIHAGGDTDTTAAIAGALAGIQSGEAGIPAHWLAGVKEWPMSIDYLRKLSSALATSKHHPEQTIILRQPSLLPLLGRNLLFFCIIMLHGFRRLLPPY